MGWNFRKSTKIGPIRITSSKRGTSYSIGGKGYRITKQANGKIRTTASIPGTGISYSETSGGRSRRSKSQVRSKSRAKKSIFSVLGGAWKIFGILFLICLVIGAIDSIIEGDSHDINSPVSSAAVTSTGSLESVEATIKDAVEKCYGENVTFSADETGCTSTIWVNGLYDTACDARDSGEGSDAMAKWDEFLSLNAELSSKCAEVAHENGYDEYMCAINVVKEDDHEHYIAMIVNGNTMYDAVRD